MPCPRLVIRLGPLPDTASVMPVDATASQDSLRLSLTPAHDHRPAAQDSVATPPDTTPRNLRLEHAQAALSKKRKPLSDNKVSSSSTKKPKTSPGVLAMLPAGNSIKLVLSHIYICYTNDPPGVSACGAGININLEDKALRPILKCTTRSSRKPRDRCVPINIF